MHLFYNFFSIMAAKINKTFLSDSRFGEFNLQVPKPNQNQNCKIEFIKYDPEASKKKQKKIERKPKSSEQANEVPISHFRSHCKKIKQLLQQDTFSMQKFINSNESKNIRKTEISSNNVFTEKELQNLTMQNTKNRIKEVHTQKRKMNQKAADIKKQIEQNLKWIEGVVLPTNAKEKKQVCKKFQFRKPSSYTCKLQFINNPMNKLKRQPSIQDLPYRNTENTIKQIEDVLQQEGINMEKRLLEDKRFNNQFLSTGNLKRIAGIYEGRMMKMTRKLFQKKGLENFPYCVKFIDENSKELECKSKFQNKEENGKLTFMRLQVHEQRVKEQRKRFIEKLKV